MDEEKSRGEESETETGAAVYRQRFYCDPRCQGRGGGGEEGRGGGGENRRGGKVKRAVKERRTSRLSVLKSAVCVWGGVMGRRRGCRWRSFRASVSSVQRERLSNGGCVWMYMSVLAQAHAHVHMRIPPSPTRTLSVSCCPASCTTITHALPSLAYCSAVVSDCGSPLATRSLVEACVKMGRRR